MAHEGALQVEATPAGASQVRGLLNGDAELAGAVVVLHEPPALDAIEVLARRAPGGAADLPIVVVVDGCDRALRRQLLAAGAHEVVERAQLSRAALAEAIGDARARLAARPGPGGDTRQRFAVRMLDHLLSYVGLLAVDGTLLDINAAPLAVSGLTLDEVKGRKFWDLPWSTWHPDVRARLRDACLRAARGEVVRYDAVARTADDGRMTIDVQIVPLRDASGAITHLVASAVDITERARAEERARRSEADFKRLFETNLLGIIFGDANGAIRDANDEFLRIIGYDRADLEAGRIDWMRLTPAEHLARDARAVDELRRTGRHKPFEKEYLRKDGSRVWVLIGAAVTGEDRGVAFVLDISRQKEAEAALRKSEQLARDAAARAEAERGVLDAILEAAAAGIILADETGRLVRFNPANELLWGPAPLSGSVDEYREWKGWWADDSERRGRRIEPHEWALARALRGEIVRNDIVEIEPFGAPGVRRTMVNSGAPVRDATGRITGGVIVQLDITALGEAQAAARESEARFRALADNIAQLAWMTDESGYIFWYNRRWFEFTGSSLEEMKGMGWQRVHHPDHVGRVTEKFFQHVATGEPWEDTFPLRRRDGQYRWFLSRAFPLRDAAGRVLNWFGTNTDITAQVEAEEALREADRRKDEFIGILAHELRNPLAPVRTAAEILRRIGPTEPRIVRASEVIERQVRHMARLVDDLLDVSRIARGKLELQRETCDLAAIARQTAEDYRASLEAAGLSLVVPAAPEPVWVEGDPVRLAQMVGNLLQNAARFTDPGGRVEVRVEAELANRQAVVRVSDTGVGIEPSLLSRLFDPFSQADQGLARSKGGLGLGLALTKGLAELHGGGVAAESAGPGRGSTFALRIPLSRARHDLAPRAPLALGRPRLRVLVVEDNRDAAETLGTVLELGGHEVELAYDGSEALAAARARRPDAVICDIGLPGPLDGYAVARALRREPSLAGVYLVALTGYANDEARRRSREAGFDAHFAKPPDLARLERALAERTRTGPAPERI